MDLLVFSTSVAPNDLEHAVKYVNLAAEHPVYYHYVMCLNFSFWSVDLGRNIPLQLSRRGHLTVEPGFDFR